ncbi:MAG: isochorismate synthase [Bowdeniella nasicola]|nr:isochorismate synthase [Bowdeniella nasicola]
MPNGPHLSALQAHDHPTVWMHGVGAHATCVIGVGQYARFEAHGEDRFGELYRQFAKLAATLPVRAAGIRAFVTTTFAPTSPRSSVLIVPQVQWQFTPGNTRCIDLRSEPTIHGAPPRFGRRVVRAADTLLARDAYERAVAKAVEKIRAGELEKTVLARSHTLHLDGPVPIGALSEQLHRAYPSCWTFYVDGMIGASPEMLVSVRNGAVHSRALAGSAPVSGDSHVDNAAAAALLASDKDRSEHAYAADSVRTVLEKIADVTIAPTRVVELPTIMHLATDITGQLRRDISALEIAGMLHPSAAICGTPTEGAAAVLTDLEGADRGRYSAPVGWVDDSGNGEFVIALRCAEVAATSLTMYAGAGIVAQSDPATEYLETETKMLPIRRAVAALDKDRQ